MKKFEIRNKRIGYNVVVGHVVIRTPFIFDNGPDYFSEDLARLTGNGKFGFFDRHGQVVIAPQFDFALPFHEGAAAVCLGCRKSQAESDGHYSVGGGRWGFIDRRGTVIIPLKFENAEDFRRGLARVMVNKRWKYIDRRGRILR